MGGGFVGDKFLLKIFMRMGGWIREIFILGGGYWWLGIIFISCIVVLRLLKLGVDLINGGWGGIGRYIIVFWRGDSIKLDFYVK